MLKRQFDSGYAHMNEIINKITGKSVGTIFSSFDDDTLRRYFETLDKTEDFPKGWEWVEEMCLNHFIRESE